MRLGRLVHRNISKKASRRPVSRVLGKVAAAGLVLADDVPFQHRHGTLLPQPRQLGMPEIAPHVAADQQPADPAAGDLPAKPCVEAVVGPAEDVGDGVEVAGHKFLEGIGVQLFAAEGGRQGALARLGGVEHDAAAGPFDQIQQGVIARRHGPAHQCQGRRMGMADCAALRPPSGRASAWPCRGSRRRRFRHIQAASNRGNRGGKLAGRHLRAAAAKLRPRLVVADHHLAKRLGRGRLSTAADEETAQPAQLLAIELAGGRRLPGPRHVHEEDGNPSHGFHCGGGVAHLVAGGGQHQGRGGHVLLGGIDQGRGRRAHAAAPAAARRSSRLRAQPLRPQAMRRDPLRGHERLAVGDCVHGFPHAGAGCRPRTVSNSASTRTAMRTESEGE